MKNIVVGYDDSPAAQGAMRWAIDYAQLTGASLNVVYVVSRAWEWELAAIQVNTDPIRAEIKRRLVGDWTAGIRRAGLRYRTEIQVGRPAERLLAVARRDDAALIVIGMTEHGTLGDLVFRSTATDVTHHAIRPIMSVPATWEPS